MKTYYKFILKEIKQNYKKKKKNLIHELKCIRILSWSLLGIALVDIAFEILVLKFGYGCSVLNILFLIFLAVFILGAWLQSLQVKKHNDLYASKNRERKTLCADLIKDQADKYSVNGKLVNMSLNEIINDEMNYNKLWEKVKKIKEECERI